MAKSNAVAFYVAYVRGEVAGAVWLNRLQSRWMQCSAFTFRDFWGAAALGLGRHCLRELLCMRDSAGDFILDMLVCITPRDNQAALAFVRRCGWRVGVCLPAGIFDARVGASVPAVLHYVTREDV
jgi:hypothetical protein